MKPIVSIPGELLERCERFALDVVEGYRDGRKEFSRRLGVPGKPSIWGNASVQYCGRLGEVAWCMYLGLNPNKALDWSKWCDHGTDFTIGQYAVDVKSTNHEYGSRLIWPVGKNRIWHQKTFNTLALARIEQDDNVRLLGVCSKRRFELEAVTSDGNDRLVAGTRYMHERNLFPPRDFRELVNEKNKTGASSREVGGSAAGAGTA